MRLDQYLVDNGLVPSRERGRALIMAGLVYLNGQKAEKAGLQVAENAVIDVRGEDCPYVSRGGYKLEKALKIFDTSPQNCVCMDIGASTGGFTDCLLQNGAKKVYAVDVGYGQLAWKLRCDERVVPMERTNIRNVTKEQIDKNIDYFTIDVAFISTKHVFPTVSLLSGEQCEVICLVKPQFEAGKDKVGKNGVVKDFETHVDVIKKTAEYAIQNQLYPLELDYSPVQGPKGNTEFLMRLGKMEPAAGLSVERIEEVVRRAHSEFGLA